ncbi:MAG TPA: flavodoxin [Clostridia bacterium]|nr:flavodoxin [Clostridia bacterium]
MSKYRVIYSTMTGNTEEMARAVKAGIESEGHSVELIEVKNATQGDVDESSGVALGCPALGAEVLSDEMAAFVSTVNIQDKPIVLFGSYDWGNGEWMDDWELVMKKNGAKLKTKGLIVHTEPSSEDLEDCKALGKQLI